MNGQAGATSGKEDELSEAPHSGSLIPLEVRLKSYENTANQLKKLTENFEDRFPAEWHIIREF